jgi:hypothetical protein
VCDLVFVSLCVCVCMFVFLGLWFCVCGFVCLCVSVMSLRDCTIVCLCVRGCGSGCRLGLLLVACGLWLVAVACLLWQFKRSRCFAKAYRKVMPIGI